MGGGCIEIEILNTIVRDEMQKNLRGTMMIHTKKKYQRNDDTNRTNTNTRVKDGLNLNSEIIII